MVVTCPNCTTKFNLPDNLASEGAKLRCSVCKHVFNCDQASPTSLNLDNELGAEQNDFISFSESKKKPKRGFGKLGWLALSLVVIAGVLAGVLFTPYGAALKSFSSAQLTSLWGEKPVQDPADLVRLIALRGVRQYNVSNEKLGNISVIEGKAVNGFPTPRELIRLEGALYDAAGSVLVAKQQLAGTMVSLFQLQVLGEQELEQALANKIDILSNNTNVMPGAEVPFMIVFYNPPDNAAEFGVKIIDAKIPPAAK